MTAPAEPSPSQAEAVVHPGVYRRRGGAVHIATVQGSGFGYRLEKIERELPDPIKSF